MATPILNTVSPAIGYISNSIFHEKLILSKMQKRKNTDSDNRKLINDETDAESRNIYLGTLIFEKIGALFKSATIPVLVVSRKYEKSSVPQKRYMV